MDDKCVGWLGVRRCRFEPRYDTIEPVATEHMWFFSTDRKASDLVCKRTYVQDVCVRCGETRQRPPSAPGQGSEG